MIRLLAETNDMYSPVHVEIKGTGKEMLSLMSTIILDMAKDTHTEPKIICAALMAMTEGLKDEYDKADKVTINETNGVN